MQLSAVLLAALSLSARVLAQDPVVTCGRAEYTYEQIDEAAEAACDHVKDKTTAGSNKYPHSYRNFEKFEFDGVKGPYYNFPMMPNGRIYTSGAPGTDRVIINQKCELAGQITHTGASSRNGFVDCEEAISVKTERNSTSSDSGTASAPGILLTGLAGALMLGAFM